MTLWRTIAGDSEAEAQRLGPLHAPEVLLRDDVPWHRLQAAVLDQEDLLAHVLQEADVVRCDHHSVWVMAQLLGEPSPSLEVQVVRGFVQEQELRLEPQSLGQLDLHAPTCREVLHRRVQRRCVSSPAANVCRAAETQSEQHAADLVRRPPPAAQLHPDLLQPAARLARAIRGGAGAKARRCQALLQAELLPDELLPTPLGAQHLVEDAAGEGGRERLAAEDVRAPGGWARDATIGNQPQQRALPTAARTREAVASASPGRRKLARGSVALH
mmetsp:Transcript_80787/g.232100  ORF Transcript_80787/g.232100 Transcript_80787/m.232100 type:complete len:272 (+) Transcript_80787:1434-2249(+)